MRRFLVFLIFVMVMTLSGEWTVVETFIVPEGAAGLAWDGEYLYCGIYGVDGDEFYQIDPAEGSWQFAFSVPDLGDCFGLTYDGEHLWTTDHPGSAANPAIAMELDMNGNIISQFNLPDHYMSGICYDSGDFWVSTYYDPDGFIYRLDDAGNILQSFAAPDNQPWDLCRENEFLWMADYWGDALYKIDPTDGSLIESHASEGVDPSGIVYDGQYLWYCDNGQGAGQDYLYKVDLGGGGNPAIELGFTEYDFGEVIVGETGNVDLPVNNTGTANLSVTSVEIPSAQFSAIFQPPLVVEPGGTGYIGITFSPDNWGDFSAIMEIGSNDPVNPLEEVELTGSGVFADADIEVTPVSLDFGTVRVNGYTGEPIMISNQGTGDLIISDMDIAGENYQINVLDELPVTLATNEVFEFSVWFNPTAEMNYPGNLMIVSNDPDESPFEVSLAGIGEIQNFTIGQQIWEYEIDTSYDNSPKAISAVPDVNGDNRDDVIICSEDGYIRCFNGNSADWADVVWEIELGNVYSQSGLSIADDIDDDGYVDVAVGTAGGRTIYLLSGLTGEVIWEHDTTEYGSGGWVYQVDSSYDYNDDGLNDILAAVGNDGNGTGPQRAYCLDAVSGISIWEFYTAGPKFSVLGISDANDDGVPDAVTGASNVNETTGLIYGIDGANGNQMWVHAASGSSVWALAQLGDINGDGVSDVAAGDFSGNCYGLNAASGNELWSGNIGTSIILRFALLDDVNSDGYPDISVAHSTFDNAVVLDGFDGSNIWSQPVADQPWNLSRIDDISGDGINDVVVGTLFTSSYVYYLDGVNGSELSSVYVGTPVDAIGVIHDIDGNGSMEVVAGGRNGWVYCYSGGTASAVGTIQGYVYDSNMQPLEGVVIDIGGIIVITDVSGYFMLQLPPGYYPLNASLEGYLNVSMNVTVIEGETTEVEIIMPSEEEILPPQNVTADEGGYISWTAPPGALLFNIYWDGNLMAQTEETSFQMSGLIFNHYYEIGISAVYEMAESEMVTVGFIYTGYHQFGDIDDNDQVEAFDAAIALQYVVGLDPVVAPLPWEDWRIAVADVDGNDEVGAYDSALILQYVVGIIEIFPVELPLRCDAPLANVDIRVENDRLIFSSEKNLYAFTLQVDNSDKILGNPNISGEEVIMAYNQEDYTLALASASEIKGDFLSIPFKHNASEICLSLVINTEKIRRTVYLNSDPVVSSLNGNYPNPFNPETTISFQIAVGETGELSIFNVKGQRLIKESFGSGEHTFRWQAKGYGSGIYFYRLSTGSFSKTYKMVMIK
ncbi:MAG: choice-of-anchor D domain-containing protein [Candidatus Stygibacter australis]|nr:choice-of-anchor D domain-containing protein [Candidatus Stygibacter australis]